MKYLIVFFFIGLTHGVAQTIDYNTKKGFVAEGYDIVAYFNNEAIKGDETYKTTYDGVNFKFSTQNNLDLFLKSPTSYIPQYGGYCAYAVAENSTKVDIDPKTFTIIDNKLYLFYNSWGNNTLKKWNENNVKGLQEKADLNWEAIKFQ